MNFSAIKNTKYWTKWWANRKIDWQKSYNDTWNHPHRTLISQFLTLFGWTSLLEVGCASGPNLINIIKHHKGKQVGGVDPNPEAIELAQKTFKNGVFRVGTGEDILMSDSSVDVVLSDMALIYVNPRDIKKYLKEYKRVARNNIILCELHHKNPLQRLKLKVTSGYNAYNYHKLLKKVGFYDIIEYKLKEKDWPGGNPQKTFGSIFIARVPKRK